MALKDLLITNLPEYSENLISGKSVFFRPLIVSEEKAILIAKQSGNKQTLLKTLINVISAFLSLRIKLIKLIFNFKQAPKKITSV